MFNHCRTVTKGCIQLRLGFQVPFKAFAIFALQLDQHFRHGQHFSGGVSKGQPQLFSAINRAGHKSFIGAAGFRSQRPLKLPQHGQLFIQPHTVVSPDAAGTFHQILDSGHFCAKGFAHINHLACQLLGKFHLAQSGGIGGKVTEHLPHKFRRVRRCGLERKRQGIGDFRHLRQFITRQSGNGSVNIFRGFNELHRAGTVGCTEAQGISLNGLKRRIINPFCGGIIQRVIHFNCR